MAVGSNHNSFNLATETVHSKTEIYDHSTSTWESKNDYPLHEGVRRFQTVPFASNFLVFGGEYLDEVDVLDTYL